MTTNRCWTTCGTCGKRVVYNETVEDTGSLLYVTDRAPWERLVAFTERDDDGNIVSVICYSCDRAKVQEHATALHMGTLTEDEFVNFDETEVRYRHFFGDET